MSAYRDDREALRARVEHLEGELSEARSELDRLRGGGASAEAALARGGNPFLGAPTTLRLRRRVDGELPAEAMDELVDVLRERFGAVGTIEQGGRGLAWKLQPPDTNRVVQVTVVPADGRTVIRVTERLGNLAGGLFGGIVGGVGGGGLGLVLPLTALIAPLAAPVAGAVWLLTTYGAVRAGYRASVRRRATELGAVIDELSEITARRTGTATPPRARVAAEAADADPAEKAEAELAGAHSPTREVTRGQGE